MTEQLSPLAWRLRRCLLSLEREVVMLSEIWACLLSMEPELVDAPDRRARLRETIDELVDASWLRLPDDRTAYDHTHRPPLPRKVRLIAPAQRATRVGVSRGVPWHPALAWAADVPLADEEHADLLRIDEWLREDRPRVIVPPRERSLELFGAGNEDHLHTLSRSELFGPGRLTWDLLCCAPVLPPLVWSAVGNGATLLVVSSHETFASMRRALVEAPPGAVGVVAHGARGYFVEAVPFSRVLDRPIERILYFGDLDADDLRTAVRANMTAREEHLPPVEPAVALYELLLRRGQPAPTVPTPLREAQQLAEWMPEPLRTRMRDHLVGGRRIAQEWLGYEVMIAERVWSLLG